MRATVRGLRLLILTAFAVFFVIPIGWLILAPTKADGALVTRNPLSFGSFHQVALAWDHLDGFSDHIYRLWIGNSLLYALQVTVLSAIMAVPIAWGVSRTDMPAKSLIRALILGASRCGLLGLSVTRPPPWNEAPAPTRSAAAAAVRTTSEPPMQ